MFVMGHNQLPPQLKKFRRLVYISPVITILSLTLLLWTYRFALHLGGKQSTVTLLPPLPSVICFGSGGPTQPSRSGPNIPEQPAILRSQCSQQFCFQNTVQEKKVPFVAVTGTKTLLVSAYLEHRTGKREVCLIAVVLRSETVAYRCVLRCQEQLYISEGVSQIHSDHFGFAYGTADIMCPLPSRCETPSHITVTSAADNSGDTLPEEFLEVKNQKAQNDSFPYNFTVCLSTMYDFTNVLQLVQSLEMLQLLGVNRVVVYKTNSSPETQRVLDYYTYKGLVEVIPWSLSRFLNVSRGWLPLHGPGDLHYFGQIPALNDCVYRHMYQSRYVALHDMDELILPQSVKSWLELLPLLEREYGIDKCFMFENNVFPITVTPSPTSQTLPLESCCPSWQNVSGVNILAHLYQEPILTHTYDNIKTIVNPRAVFSATVHGLLSSVKGCSTVDRNIARMYHTRAAVQTQLTSDQMIYDDRLLKYSAQLIPNVNSVLRESRLLPEDSIQ